MTMEGEQGGDNLESLVKVISGSQCLNVWWEQDRASMKKVKVTDHCKALSLKKYENISTLL
jgi:hypothetical protein